MSTVDVKSLSLTELRKTLIAKGVDAKKMLKGEMQKKLTELLEAEAGGGNATTEEEAAPEKPAAPVESAPAPVAEISKPAAPAPAAAPASTETAPVKTVATDAVPATEEGTAAPVTNLDRAKRFGLPVRNEDSPISGDRMKNRAARFGVSTSEPTATGEKRNKQGPKGPKLALSAEDKESLVRVTFLIFVPNITWPKMTQWNTSCAISTLGIKLKFKRDRKFQKKMLATN
jgi:hypothetical protein